MRLVWFTVNIGLFSKIKKLRLPIKIVKTFKDGVVNSDLIIICTPLSEY